MHNNYNKKYKPHHGAIRSCSEVGYCICKSCVATGRKPFFDVDVGLEWKKVGNPEYSIVFQIRGQTHGCWCTLRSQ